MNIIENMKNCTGCGACALVCPQNAIKMILNSQGFFEPLVDVEKCVLCKKCNNSCHINTKPTKNTYLDAIIAINKDDTVRQTSTSGGVFYELAKTILQENGIVIGAAWNDNFLVEHIIVDDISQISKLQYAKYMQSNLHSIYEHVRNMLLDNRRVLFSGTPCQIGGLKSFLGKDEPGLILVEIVCHGVPSQEVWKRHLTYCKEQSNTSAKEISINMRSKKTGWATYSVEIEYEDGSGYSRRCMDDPYMLAFIYNMTLRSSCLNCQYKGYDRIGDITLGDCWGIWNFAPEMNDNNGASLVLVNSKKGRKIWNLISDSFDTKAINLEEIIGENMALMESSIPHSQRERILECLDQDGYQVLLDETDKIRTELIKARNQNSTKTLRKVLATVKRLLKQKLSR